MATTVDGRSIFRRLKADAPGLNPSSATASGTMSRPISYEDSAPYDRGAGYKALHDLVRSTRCADVPGCPAGGVAAIGRAIEVRIGGHWHDPALSR
jgi:hypothetical protein